MHHILIFKEIINFEITVESCSPISGKPRGGENDRQLVHNVAHMKLIAKGWDFHGILLDLSTGHNEFHKAQGQI